MGLFQRAVETYDCNASRVGVYHADESEPLAPVGHMIAKANVEITLDQDGNFISASMVDKADEKTIIPATEDSLGRASTSAKDFPHPLCDMLKYIDAKDNYYIPLLETWTESMFSHPKLSAVLAYVKKRNIRQDLEPYHVDDDTFIRWRVVGLGEDGGSCWTDKKLFQAHIEHLASEQNDNTALCMVTGEIAPVAHQNSKGVVARYGNAKLISFKDDELKFKYRGRFTDETQAATISYTASQKAHNALRWLVANQGKAYGGRTFLCWNPQGIRVGSPVQAFYGGANRVNPSDYKNQLAATLLGRKKELRLQGNESAVVAVFDAATTGRLALTYYNEISVSSFLDRMCRWDEYCCWWNGRFGIQPPSILQLVNCAFGTQRIENHKEPKLVTDDRVMRQELQALLACRLSEAAFPEHIRAALVHRAGTPQAFEPEVWRRILHSACSAINMTTFQRRGEEIMSWSLDKPDRSFQFGRLLAAMERAEEDYYYLTGETGRQTNAMKQMSAFRQRPLTVYEQVNRQLNNAYLSRLKPWQRARYQRLKDEIVSILRDFPETELNKPLSELYLMGYDLQHSAFFKNENKTETEETEHE